MNFTLGKFGNEDIALYPSLGMKYETMPLSSFIGKDGSNRVVDEEDCITAALQDLALID